MSYVRIPRLAHARAPAGTTITHAERMSPAFTKYFLSDGRVLHRFTREEPHSDPHDHPWSFETTIVEGGYVEEVFYPLPGGGWTSACVHRLPGQTYQVGAEHIHRIVRLPEGECWTVVRAGRHVRGTRFWQFGDGVQSRAWNERRWTRHD